MANYNLPGGSRKGRPNKVSGAFRDDIWAAYKELGGVAYLVRQGRENPHLFMALIARLLPRQPAEALDAVFKRLVDMSDEEIYALTGDEPPDIEGSPEPPTIDEPPLLPPPPPPWEKR